MTEFIASVDSKPSCPGQYPYISPGPHPGRKAVSSQQMARSQGARCAARSARSGAPGSLVLLLPTPPTPRVASSARVSQRGRGEGRGGWEHGAPVPGRSPRVLRPPPFPSEPCHLAARAASAPPHLPLCDRAPFSLPPPSSSLSLILTFRLASLCPLPGGFSSQAGAPAPACPPPHHLQL